MDLKKPRSLQELEEMQKEVHVLTLEEMSLVQLMRKAREIPGYENKTEEEWFDNAWGTGGDGGKIAYKKALKHQGECALTRRYLITLIERHRKTSGLFTQEQITRMLGKK